MTPFHTDLLLVALSAVVLACVVRSTGRRAPWLCATYLLTCLLSGVAGAGYWVLRLDPRVRLTVYSPDDLGDIGRTLYCAAVAILWTSLAWIALLRLLRRRRPADACPQCGYLLRGLTSPRCPECGTPIALSTSEH